MRQRGLSLAQRNDNARTLIFCAFSGEELGLLGSKAFVKQVKTDSIKAVINIEMIGLPKIRNSFFITGMEYSDLGDIISRNLAPYKFWDGADPYEDKSCPTFG